LFSFLLENTIESIKRALNGGAQVVLIDIQLTKDKKVKYLIFIYIYIYIFFFFKKKKKKIIINNIYYFNL